MAMRKTLGAAALVASLSGSAWAADYYIDAAIGNDANPGTAAQPWKSLSRGQDVRSNGFTGSGVNTVFVRDTSGFLPSGSINIGGDVYSYSSITPTSFVLDSPTTAAYGDSTIISDTGFVGFQPGDTIKLSGTFSQETLRYATSGGAGNPITYTSANPNNRALISLINYAPPGTEAAAVWNDGESGRPNGSNTLFDGFDIFVDQNGQGKKPGIQASGANNVDLENMRINVSGSNGGTSGGSGVRYVHSNGNDINKSQLRSRFDNAVEAQFAGGSKTSSVNVTNTLVWDSRIGLTGLGGSTVDAEHITFVGGNGTGGVSDLWAAHSEGTVTLDNSIVFDDPKGTNNESIGALNAGGSNAGSGDYNVIFPVDADPGNGNPVIFYGGNWTPGANDVTGTDPGLLGLAGPDATNRIPGGMFPTDADPLFAMIDNNSFAATAGPGGGYVGWMPPIPEPGVGMLLLGGAVMAFRRRRGV